MKNLLGIIVYLLVLFVAAVLLEKILRLWILTGQMKRTPISAVISG